MQKGEKIAVSGRYIGDWQCLELICSQKNFDYYIHLLHIWEYMKIFSW